MRVDRLLIQQAKESLANALCNAGLFSYLLDSQILVEQATGSMFIFPAADNFHPSSHHPLHASVGELFAAKGWPAPAAVHHGAYDQSDLVYYDHELWEMVANGRVMELCDPFMEINFCSTEALDEALRAIVNTPPGPLPLMGGKFSVN